MAYRYVHSEDAGFNDVKADDITDDFLLKIIRHNAFGPDFYTYESVKSNCSGTLSSGHLSI